MTITVTSAQVDLAWTDASNNEDGFIIERSDNGSAWAQVGQTITDVVSFSDTTVLPANNYEYQVYAFNANGNSLPSNIVQAATPDVLPADPTGLMTTAVTSAQVDLAWTDASSNESGFIVERSDYDAVGGIWSAWNQVGETTADIAVFSDLTVSPASDYMYRVYAWNTAGTSANSNEITVTTTTGIPPAAPSNLVITNYTASSLTLAWTDNSTDETGFTVQIATDKNFSQSLQTANVGANVTVYMFFPLAPNTKYYMRVAAFNGAGSSSWTPTLSDKTLK
jgi:titin